MLGLSVRVRIRVGVGLKRAKSIVDGNNTVCRLCIKDATAVVYVLKDKQYLNKKSELMPTCGNIKTYLLKFTKFQIYI